MQSKPKNKVQLVTIACGTASGKTTVANKIAEILQGKKIVYLKMDHYYKKLDDLTLAERKRINFDHPNALDLELLVNHLELLKNYQDIQMPNYDFTISNRSIQTTEIKSGDVIILDGILGLALEEIRKLSDIKIFIKTEDDIRFIRRLTRDLSERGRTVESIINQYLTTIKPMHEYFVEPSIKYADIIVPYYEGNEIAIDMIATKIKALLLDKK
ncbi:uridine kinase [Spiroplasma endosymbiont of Megaselia nigra]|uniref:uridine kinase n=1 Tax=Spiroplasma endosymbiont of Megaselia nigra TaxID=2478537 RepID=UPI000F85DA25|nr:uridine kinase [Spiroplasma endosymbiont of Megaselia nigra]RUO86104.1 uridine kinase [Spiroplasma endosymbiont of Megaselia nigra]